jgi:NADH pyrophosphatase NudC (nudix superfamily)
MDIGSIFLFLALVTLVAFFITQPFLNRQSVAIRPVSAKQPILNLQSERDRVILALQELDFDYALGKVPEEDYPPQRNALLQQGAEVLQKLDALQPQSAARRAQDRLEDALAARRQAISQAASEMVAPKQDENLEVLISARRRARNGTSPREKSVGFCPQCGKSIQKSDRFCPKCGTELG